MEHIPTSYLVATLIILILISAFFSGTETSMMAINRYRLKSLVQKNNKKAKRVQKLLKNIEKLIGVILLGNNFVNILASAIFTIIVLRVWGENTIALASLLLTFVILVFAEVTPKTFAANYPEKVALNASFIIEVLTKILKPFVLFINYLSKLILLIFRIKKGKENNKIGREELKIAVREAKGFVSLNYQKMLLDIINLEKVEVDDIMIHYDDLIGIEINDNIENILSQLEHTQHTRLLVFDNDNIVGTIHTRSIVNLLASGEFNKGSLKNIIKKPYFIPLGISLSKQLENFQLNKRRLALVVDEYGGVKGMVVLEDILEEIVGQFTSNLFEGFRDIEKQKDGSYLVDGRVTIRELNRFLKTNLPSEDFKTLNGLILEYLEDIPTRGISIKIEKVLFEIVQVSNHIIKLVKIKL